jgi:pimeloyl-ACP methyl ester carboxylesterase
VATFLLIHGANLGGWCWRLITPSLRYAGHEVYAPSLTGCGERSHLLSPQIGLDTWVEDVASLIWYEDLDNLVLVGHSNAGVVALGAANRMPERVAHVVAIDSVLPAAGQSIWDALAPDTREWMQRNLDLIGETWKSPPAPIEGWVEMARAEGWNEVIGRWAGQRAGWSPLKPLKDALTLKPSEAFDKLPKTFVRCVRAQTPGSDLSAAAREAGWDVVKLAAGHLPMLGAPRELTDLLLQIALPYGA